MEPVRVNGEEAHPLFAFLKQKAPGLLINDIFWNYTKFFVGPEGIVARRLPPAHDPQDLIKAVVDTLPKKLNKQPK